MPSLSLADELAWLKANPQFTERPATLREFLGPNYLNIEKGVRKAIIVELENIFGDAVDGRRITKVQRAMITGGIGIGKTTVASIVLPYLAHWVLCLKDPQGFFDLLPGSRIAFMQMSTSEDQAKEVVFGDIKARIEYSPWFKNHPYDRAFKNQLRFEKDIWILPGDSKETTFEGYNILGGILDEADSHQVTKVKDYAAAGYDTISSRITSRFEDRGFLLVIGQMKKANGFAARKFAELKKDPTAYVTRMAIWESMGWEHYLNPDGTRNSFWYDPERKDVIPKGIVDAGLHPNKDALIEVPVVFLNDFMNNPEKALRDHAGIPPATGSPFISLTYKVTDAVKRWEQRYGMKVGPVDQYGRVADWFKATTSLKHVGHIDLAYSAEGDGLGLAMGHVQEMVEIDGELKPYIIIDLLMRMAAPAGREIFLGDVRRFVYDLRDHRGFKLVKVTMDGFQSTDTKQQFQKRRIESEIVSIDKQLTPYYDLREAIYEDRIEFPPYLVRLRPDDTILTEIVVKELTELVDNGNKIDHPDEGSKDVSDAVAGVVYELMGDRTYQKKMMTYGLGTSQPQRDDSGPLGIRHPAIIGGGMSMPRPPAGATAWNPPNLGRRT